MHCGAIILGREGRPVYQNPLGHTSMPSIRIISMSTAGRFICRAQEPRHTQHGLRLGWPTVLGHMLSEVLFDRASFYVKLCNAFLKISTTDKDGSPEGVATIMYRLCLIERKEVLRADRSNYTHIFQYLFISWALCTSLCGKLLVHVLRSRRRCTVLLAVKWHGIIRGQ